LDATPEQVANMWLRFDLEFKSWGTWYNILNIGNSMDKGHYRLPLYKEGLAKLKHGEWLGNSIIDFFTWKLFDMLNELGIKDMYKRFKITDSGFAYQMYFANEHYDLNACHHWVTKKDVNYDGHIFSFLSHKMVFVPVNINNVHLVLFAI
jgi:hypothetical protein